MRGWRLVPCFSAGSCSVWKMKHSMVAGLIFRRDTFVDSTAISPGGGAGELNEFLEKSAL